VVNHIQWLIKPVNDTAYEALRWIDERFLVEPSF
jgi:hypothetical protein